ncbi:hypothetical protein [Vibrio splendidus]|uniref:Uncharacterized protein n=1 Tax=Vibrio splendidus TaxID=29497 RepID=A0A2N7JKE6_VIBSP|nr:hypothetical protein [Vibrio splendidus]PMM41199.1 hypothetical protein BCT54_10775 [Vibrio splendidus]
MNVVEKACKYLSNHFKAPLVSVHNMETEQPPMQLRKSVKVSVGLINGMKFHIVELFDERMFASNGTMLLDKLEDRLHDKPIIFVSERLKSSSMAVMRQRGMGYIVPSAFCFIPQFLLQHSVQKEKLISNTPLSIFATTIVMQYLESQIDTQCPATDIDLFGSKMSKSRAITELEERNIIEVSKHGRTNMITFIKSKLELWSARNSLLAPICSKVVTVSKEQINCSPTQTYSGETALSIHTLLTPPKRKCIAMDEWLYDSIVHSPYELDEYNLDDNAFIDIHVYPMKLKVDRLRNSLYISPISLVLSKLKPSDERAFSSYRELEDKITHELQNQVSQP